MNAKLNIIDSSFFIIYNVIFSTNLKKFVNSFSNVIDFLII